MPSKPELPSFLLEHNPWQADKNPIWFASSLILLRNLARYKFPAKLSEAQAKSVLTLLEPIFQTSPLLKTPTFLIAEELPPLDKEFLFEHYLCKESFQNTAPGQGFVVDASGEFFASFNLHNHLQLQLIQTSSNIEEGWARLSKIEHEIAQKAEFAFSPKFGYLTSDPTQCGTALLATFYLHLPALNHMQELHATLDKQKDEDLIATSLEGSIDDMVGDILVLQNHYTLGLSEENILRSLQNATFKLMAAEKSLRTRLQKESHAALKDQIGRSFGLLTTAYQLQAKEAFNSLSLLKLGVDLGWVINISAEKINTLLFQCRRGHLAHLLKERVADPQELARKRAEFIHTQLQGMQLKE
jgi:protein arginine kinase